MLDNEISKRCAFPPFKIKFEPFCNVSATSSDAVPISIVSAISAAPAARFKLHSIELVSERANIKTVFEKKFGTIYGA